MRILSVEDVNCDIHANQLIDWGPQCNPFATERLLAIAIQDKVFIQDVLTKGSPLLPVIETQDEIPISAISFDRSGGAMLVAKKSGLVSIFDVSTG